MVEINPASTYVQRNPVQPVKNQNAPKESPFEKKPAEEKQQQNSPGTEVSVEAIKKGVDNFNRIFKPTHLEFQMHDASGKYFVSIIDETTEKVIKQIPSEEFLEMVARAKEQSGIIIDERI
jgi:flagellar protein FlaG